MLEEQRLAHKEETTLAIQYVNELSASTMGKLTKEKQERQNMADNDERVRQKSQAHKNSLRNQENAIERPGRAKPKAKSEPIFKTTENIANTIQEIQDIVSNDWLDPSTFRVAFTLNHPNPLNPVTGCKPLPWNPAVFFRRARVMSGGVVIEDIDDFKRLSVMLTALKPVDEQKEIAMEGFGLFADANDSLPVHQTDWGVGTEPGEEADKRKAYRVSDWDESGSVRYWKTVLFKPMLGILNQEKLIPLRYAPLTIELELVNKASDCVFVGRHGVDATYDDNWNISDIQCKCGLLTLDSSLRNEYASRLLSGKSLPINFSSFNHSNQSTGGDCDFSAHVHRSLTRLKSVFVTLFKDSVPGQGPPEVKLPGERKVCNDFYHPASAFAEEDLEKAQHSVWLQVGSKLYPEYPIRSSCESFYQLRQTVGHPIHIYSRWYHTTKYIVGIDMEQISGAGFTGLSTKAGDLLTINFRGCRLDSYAYSIPSRVYCALHYDAVLNIRSEGVELLD